MSENGWTPGPYVYGRREPHCKITAIAHCGDFVIGPDSNYEGGNYRDTEIGTDEADARLLAASPALAEALEWALAEIDGRTNYSPESQRDNCIAKARAALSLAKNGST